MNVLAIGAHPDDLEYGCAGTLIQHAHRGDAVYLMIITDGDKGGDPELRHQEQLDAASELWSAWGKVMPDADRPFALGLMRALTVLRKGAP